MKKRKKEVPVMVERRGEKHRTTVEPLRAGEQGKPATMRKDKK